MPRTKTKDAVKVTLSPDREIYEGMRAAATNRRQSVTAYLEDLHLAEEQRATFAKQRVENFGKVGARKITQKAPQKAENRTV